MKKYCYLFLPKNLIPEQVAIQAAHVSMVMGFVLQEQVHHFGADYDPEEITFVMTPAYASFEDIQDDLDRLGFAIEVFEDYTYTFDESGALIESEEKEVKAMMTHPIDEDKRGILRGLPLYRIKK